MSVDTKTKAWRTGARIAGPLVALLFVLFVDLKPGQPELTRTAAIAIWMAIWWLSEAVPLAATALLPLVLYPLAGVSDAREIAGAYINSTIFLFLGGFMLALAMERWQLHRRIALRIILFSGGRSSTIVLGFMLAAALLSMWISNTATAIMMLPMALAILRTRESHTTTANDSAQQLTPCLLLGIAYAASIGGMATPVGTPPNLILAHNYQQAFPDAPALSFSSWMFMAVPFSLIMLTAAWLLLTRVFFRVPAGASEQLFDRSELQQQYAALGPASREERAIFFVFLATALAWCFRSDLKLGATVIPGWSRLLGTGSFLDDASVAICAALLLFLIPVSKSGRDKHPELGSTLLDATVFRQIPWSIVLLFGGGFALAAGFVSSGLDRYLVSGFDVLHDVPLLVLIAAIAFAMTFLTELTSNTASTQMILPVLAAAAGARELHPLYLMLPATLAASMAFMMPVATPPNAIVFSSERLRISQMARTGLALNLLGVVLVTLWVSGPATWLFELDKSGTDTSAQSQPTQSSIISGTESRSTMPDGRTFAR